MNRTYQGNYYENIFLEENGGGYSDRDYWYPFFDRIAENIMMNYSPKTVLDAGCAFGYLVEALRARGVEAYGMDISDYAIGHTAKNIREYCAVGSIADEKYPASFPEKFDLIVCIEVLEHIQPEEGEKAIRNFCLRSDRVLFSSTDIDISDVTHVNVQRKEYWARLFAKEGFFRDVQQRPGYVSPQADVYHKRIDIENVIQEYEIVMRVNNVKRNKVYYESSVFFDKGEGFGESNKITISEAICNEDWEFTAKLPNTGGLIRIDPIERACCIVTDVHFVIDDKEVKAISMNGVMIGNTWIFANQDPQILIDPGIVSELKVRGKIFVLKDISILELLTKITNKELNLEKYYEDILKKIKQEELNINEIKNTLLELKEKLKK